MCPAFGLNWHVLVDSGADVGLGEILMQLRTTATSMGVVTFLKALSRPFSSCLLLCDWGNPRSSLLVQAAAAVWCRPLLGGVVRVARGVPT
jgi:hypothetical protein